MHSSVGSAGPSRTEETYLRILRQLNWKHLEDFVFCFILFCLHRPATFNTAIFISVFSSLCLFSNLSISFLALVAHVPLILFTSSSIPFNRVNSEHKQISVEINNSKRNLFDSVTVKFIGRRLCDHCCENDFQCVRRIANKMSANKRTLQKNGVIKYRYHRDEATRLTDNSIRFFRY